MCNFQLWGNGDVGDHGKVGHVDVAQHHFEVEYFCEAVDHGEVGPW